MKNFFQRTQQKTQVTLILVLYVVIGSIGLSSYNCARCIEAHEYTALDRVGMVLAMPSIVLSAPLGYGFMAVANLSPLIVQVIGFMFFGLFQVLFLYTIVCMLLAMEYWIRDKIKAK